MGERGGATGGIREPGGGAACDWAMLTLAACCAGERQRFIGSAKQVKQIAKIKNQHLPGSWPESKEREAISVLCNKAYTRMIRIIGNYFPLKKIQTDSKNGF